jgi:hypothetical protein
MLLQFACVLVLCATSTLSARINKNSRTFLGQWLPEVWLYFYICYIMFSLCIVTFNILRIVQAYKVITLSDGAWQIIDRVLVVLLLCWYVMRFK